MQGAAEGSSKDCRHMRESQETHGAHMHCICFHIPIVVQRRKGHFSAAKRDHIHCAKCSDWVSAPQVPMALRCADQYSRCLSNVMQHFSASQFTPPPHETGALLNVAACLPVLDNAEKVCQCGRQLGRLQHLDWHRQSQRLRPILCSVEVDAPAVGADLEPNLHKHGGR